MRKVVTMLVALLLVAGIVAGVKARSDGDGSENKPHPAGRRAPAADLDHCRSSIITGISRRFAIGIADRFSDRRQRLHRHRRLVHPGADSCCSTR